MSVDVTLNLPDEVYRRAETLARLTGRDVPAVLADTLVMSLSLLDAEGTLLRPLAEASSDEVLALADLMQRLPHRSSTT